MAASIYRTSTVSNAQYGTPEVSGLIVTGFSINSSAAMSEFKDDQGGVVAVAVSEPTKEISVEGMRTGSFSQTVGGTLSISGIDLDGTTIVSGLTTTYAAEKFETISVKAKNFAATMTAS